MKFLSLLLISLFVSQISLAAAKTMMAPREVSRVGVDLDFCVMSYVATFEFSGEYNFEVFVGWYSRHIKAALESCDDNKCRLTDHGNAIDIGVFPMENQQVEVTYCDYE